MKFNLLGPILVGPIQSQDQLKFLGRFDHFRNSPLNTYGYVYFTQSFPHEVVRMQNYQFLTLVAHGLPKGTPCTVGKH